VDLLLLALKNLLARPVRSLLTLLGVLVATASMVLFLSFGEGLRRALFQELSRVGPALQVLPEGVEGFAFGGYPGITPEQARALEEAARALGATGVIPSVFLVRGGLIRAPASSSRASPKG
jgi:putative ABC transport system permease protein